MHGSGAGRLERVAAAFSELCVGLVSASTPSASPAAGQRMVGWPAPFAPPITQLHTRSEHAIWAPANTLHALGRRTPSLTSWSSRAASPNCSGLVSRCASRAARADPAGCPRHSVRPLMEWRPFIVLSARQTADRLVSVGPGRATGGGRCRRVIAGRRFLPRPEPPLGGCSRGGAWNRARRSAKSALAAIGWSGAARPGQQSRSIPRIQCGPFRVDRRPRPPEPR